MSKIFKILVPEGNIHGGTLHSLVILHRKQNYNIRNSFWLGVVEDNSPRGQIMQNFLHDIFRIKGVEIGREVSGIAVCWDKPIDISFSSRRHCSLKTLNTTHPEGGKEKDWILSQFTSFLGEGKKIEIEEFTSFASFDKIIKESSERREALQQVV